MKRVGFVPDHFGRGWLGGVNYFRNLFLAIGSLEKRSIEPVLFLPEETPDGVVGDFEGVEIVKTRLLNRKESNSEIQNPSANRKPVEELLKEHRIAIISHANRLDSASQFPNIYWIPDFQHKRRPDFFSDAEIQLRDQMFCRESELADRVVLSSFDARRDFEQSYPDQLHKTSVLRFVSGLNLHEKIMSKRELAEKYKLSGPFFYLPNQYWAHKNHTVVVEALTLLKRDGIDITVISTGGTYDYRHPDHFKDFMQMVNDRDLQDSYRALGIVPYSDLTAFMSHAIAVINPSHFEGWSTTVEEGKAMGKIVILSDIPIHLEQAPARGRYFPPDSAEALAGILAKVHAAHDEEAEEAQRLIAADDNRRDFLQFGALYQDIVFAALGE